jgi:hypothetical protein
MTKISDPDVAAAFRAFPAAARTRLLALRELIFETASSCSAGEIDESVKWGEPAYRATHGSTVRLAWKAKSPDQVAMHFICTTGLVDRFRDLYPGDFQFGGNRALLFDLESRIPRKALTHCIAFALTHHRGGKHR